MTQKRVALVTGAGSGIGKAAALALLKDGYYVALVGRRKDMLEKTAAESTAKDRAMVLPDQKCPLSGGSSTDGSYSGDISFHAGSMVLLGGELTMAHSYEVYVKWQSGANLRCFGDKLGTLQRPSN